MKKFIAAAILVSLALASQVCADGTATKKTNVPTSSVYVDMKHATKKLVPDKKNLAGHKDVVKSYTEYWDAIKKGDYKKAYSLEDARYRKKVSYDLYAYLMKKKIDIIFVEPLEVKKRNKKEVMVRGILRYRAGMINTARTFDDNWVKEGDTYRHVRDIKKEEVKNKKVSAGKK